ncbi:MAG TPA: phage holin family protein [Chitinophagaceae bacterium]
MEVEEIKDKAKDLTGHVTDYVETFYKLSVLKATDKATSVGSALITGVALAVFGLFIVIFGGIALAFWLGDLLENRALGFAIVAGFFLLLLVIVLALRKNIVFPYFRNLLIRKFYV